MEIVSDEGVEEVPHNIPKDIRNNSEIVTHYSMLYTAKKIKNLSLGRKLNEQIRRKHLQQIIIWMSNNIFKCYIENNFIEIVEFLMMISTKQN